jgi:hypothetical protein
MIELAIADAAPDIGKVSMFKIGRDIIWANQVLHESQVSDPESETLFSARTHGVTGNRGRLRYGRDKTNL